MEINPHQESKLVTAKRNRNCRTVLDRPAFLTGIPAASGLSSAGRPVRRSGDSYRAAGRWSLPPDPVKQKFPDSTLTFYEDRDRSGYTFEQREGYQAMRRELMGRRKDILIVKDFSRFSRRNSRGLVELEDLRDAGVRIISIGDNIDFPNDDDWLKIQFQFLINEITKSSMMAFWFSMEVLSRSCSSSTEIRQ